MSAKPRRCGTCKWLDVPPDKDGVRRVRRFYAYECTFTPPLPELPDAITKYAGWRWPPSRRHMTPNEGTTCPTWEQS